MEGSGKRFYNFWFAGVTQYIRWGKINSCQSVRVLGSRLDVEVLDEVSGNYGSVTSSICNVEDLLNY